MKFNYTIEYALVIKEGEPDYDEDNKLDSKFEAYTFEENNENEKNEEKAIYIGKSSYYNIIIEKELTTKNCNNNNICYLCLSIDKTNCITCKSSYHFEDNKKICEDNEIKYSILTFLTSIPSIKSSIISTSLTSLTSPLYSDYSTFSSLFSTFPIYIFNSLLSSTPGEQNEEGEEDHPISSSPIKSSEPKILLILYQLINISL